MLRFSVSYRIVEKLHQPASSNREVNYKEWENCCPTVCGCVVRERIWQSLFSDEKKLPSRCPFDRIGHQWGYFWWLKISENDNFSNPYLVTVETDQSVLWHCGKITLSAVILVYVRTYPGSNRMWQIARSCAIYVVRRAGSPCIRREKSAWSIYMSTYEGVEKQRGK